MSVENLSEKLFKPKFKYLETSLISNSGVPLPELCKKNGAFGYFPGWYRPVHRFWWVMQGGNIADIEECLSAVASSKGERSREDCYDTVAVYGGGNWIFEFSKCAQARALEGRRLREAGDLEKAAHQFRMSARYFSIASYPHLKGDVMAAEAALLGRRSYREMCECESETVKLTDFKFKASDQEISGLLHMPDHDRVHPCVILLASYEMSATGFYRLYKERLRPNGIALLVLEMPGMGLSEKLTLKDDQAEFLNAALIALKKFPGIDSTRIGLLGLRLGGSACLRTTIMSPSEVRALALIEPAVHSFFTDRNILNSLTLCLRSLYANRLNQDASRWDLVIPQLKQLSLKEQGLISRNSANPVPCMAASLNCYSSAEDLSLLEANFKDFSYMVKKDQDYSDFMFEALNNASEFFKEHLL